MTANQLWYDRPAAIWTEALPVGNGRLGAMVFGGDWSERLQINESTFWNGGPYQPVNHSASETLPEVRRLILEGKYQDAERLATQSAMADPDLQTSYQPIGDVRFSMHHDMNITGYRRKLDLSTAVAETQYQCQGITFRREVFATAIHNVLVCRLSADRPGALSMSVLLSSPQNGEPVDVVNATLGYDGHNRRQNGIQGALNFAFRVRVLADGGLIDTGPETVRVLEADSVILLIDAGTNFRRYDDVSGNPQADVLARLDAAAKIPYDTLLAAHIAEHKRLFDTMSISLSTRAEPALTTDKRIANYMQGDDPSLAALYVQYGRYLGISCSRPGTQPANLQGIWNEDILPAWNSKYTVNINTEMNYWLADPANLSETFLPLLEMMEDIAQTGQEMARVHYGARGFVLHHNTDLWRATGPIDGPHWGLWPMGGAWLSVQLYDHYRFNPNLKLLSRIYPILKGAAEFALDTLITLPGSDYLVTCPSLSPENSHPFGSSLCAGPAMDRQILRDLFDAVAEASVLLECDVDLRSAVMAARNRLPADRIGQAGQLQEWLEDWDVEAPEQDHRHVSHLYALYPSLQIDPLETAELAKAAQVALERRGDEATGWGIGWRLNLWARLGNGAKAQQVLNLLLSPERTYPNLMDAHPPFQIDGNFGGAAGILEMLVQSRPGEIRLLPALPEKWSEGRVSGIRVRGGHVIDMEWSDRTITLLTIKGGSDCTISIRHPQGIKDIQVLADCVVRVIG
ncbi:glycoside hydrolase N-terminal domain-containing protein [Brucella gallinifaecis]|uniref:Glycoside hydrolase family 95 protein n=1 Tax=Brucella gallinifaecis TaxID=215590 RepID=A0A502BSS2_9HYPH|nr:glycoside hydrolase family 95 protein [Brucella gallinifaecis]TPF76897.1 glycoside hydrolase family 95 protein [Brucella gallinifaecis]